MTKRCDDRKTLTRRRLLGAGLAAAGMPALGAGDVLAERLDKVTLRTN